jgi:hypothetical protein
MSYLAYKVERRPLALWDCHSRGCTRIAPVQVTYWWTRRDGKRGHRTLALRDQHMDRWLSRHTRQQTLPGI